MDSTDAFHLAASPHCSALYTFDNALIKGAKTLADQRVKKP
jgi:hypothetical protein